MKFIISFLIPLNVLGHPINLLYEGQLKEIKMYAEILSKDYQIPEEIISFHQTENCEAVIAKGKMDICLNKNGDLLVVSADKEFINNSLKAFRTP